MALKIIDHNSTDYAKMVELRYNILRKPLGLVFSKEELDAESNYTLIGCFDDDKIEGCCLLVNQADKTVKLKQMAVIDGLQGKGIGRALMNFAENVVKDMGNNRLIMNARKTAIGFYEKSGYNVFGEEFFEVGIPHVVMEKSL